MELGELTQLDRLILHRLHKLVLEVTENFDRYEFFKYYQLLNNFCGVDLSSFYFDIVKDRLYTSSAKSRSRRAVQTVLNEVLQVLVRILVPVTPHLAEDIWQHIPEAIKQAGGDAPSVLTTDFPAGTLSFVNQEIEQLFDDLIQVRYTVNKALEQARAARRIGSSLEAQVILLFENADLANKVASLGRYLAPFFITSQALVDNNAANNGSGTAEVLAQVAENGVKVLVLSAEGNKCPRCWKFSTRIGQDEQFPEICDDCAVALSGA